MQLVPVDATKKKVPCGYIPLNERGEMIDSLYRYGTAQELEVALGQWLKRTIERLEREKGNSAVVNKIPEVHLRAEVVASK